MGVASMAPTLLIRLPAAAADAQAGALDVPHGTFAAEIKTLCGEHGSDPRRLHRETVVFDEQNRI